ncbi:VOC family protein [Massilia sp. W12]|uniref:VOC family protein n=1 Tax=Massilia sp. W12 TaxID=3126507 RepID=UPI0030CDAF7B
MIGYVTLGTNDLERAAKFYDELLGLYGAKRLMEFPSGYVWGYSMGSPSLGILKPFDQKPASVGNGVMVALAFDSKEKVDAVYNKALELGGTDEGGPGFRGGESFYAAYFRDLDGNKLNAFCIVQG